jgi:hypothetical protein
VESFQLELAAIDRVFSGGGTAGVVDTDQRRASKTVQLLLTVLSGAYLDVNQLTGIVMGRGDWAGFFGRALQQFLAYSIVFSLFTGPVGWIVFIAVESVFVLRHHQGFKQRLIENLGPRLFESLQSELASRQSTIQQDVAAQFTEFASRLTQALQHQIDLTRAEQERIISQKRDASFVAEQEKARLDAIEAALLRSFGQASLAGYGSELSPEEFRRLSAFWGPLDSAEPDTAPLRARPQ